MGAKIPPPRAVFEGTTGPSNNSAPQIEYPNPKGDLAKRLTNKSANHRPNPVRIIPPASKKAATINQTIGSPYPANASCVVIMPVAINATKPNITIAPIG